MSFIPGHPGYAGIFFNLFYFLEERHMIFSIPYLLLCLFIIYKRQHFSKKVLLFYGMAMGAFFYWEVYVCIIVFGALIFTLLLDGKKKQTGYLFLGFIIVFICCYSFLKHVVTNPHWFIPAKVAYPQFDNTFIIGHKIPAQAWIGYLNTFITNYLFAYGLRAVFLFISLFILFRKNKQLFVALISFLLPAFLLINGVKLSPDVSENHKWIVPINILVDIVVALPVAQWFFVEKKFTFKVLGIICLFFLAISGIIELMPFLNSQPNVYYGQANSAMIMAIRRDTPPKASFVGEELPIHLAGRKLYVGHSAGPDYALNKTYRKKVISYIYHAKSIKTFCMLTKQNAIDYVEANSSQQKLLAPVIRALPGITTVNESNQPVVFIAAEKGCR